MEVTLASLGPKVETPVRILRVVRVIIRSREPESI